MLFCMLVYQQKEHCVWYLLPHPLGSNACGSGHPHVAGQRIHHFHTGHCACSKVFILHHVIYAIQIYALLSTCKHNALYGGGVDIVVLQFCWH